MNELGQSKFEGWAMIEIYGHSKAAGFVSTEYFGSACLFRVDTPELPEREFVLTRPEYVQSTWTPAGAKVKRPASPARSELLGPGSIFRLHPCSQEVAMKAIEEIYPRPLIVLEMPEQAKLTDGHDPEGADQKILCECADMDCPHHSGSTDGCEMEASGNGDYPDECGACSAYHMAEDAAV